VTFATQIFEMLSRMDIEMSKTLYNNEKSPAAARWALMILVASPRGFEPLLSRHNVGMSKSLYKNKKAQLSLSFDCRDGVPKGI